MDQHFCTFEITLAKYKCLMTEVTKVNNGSGPSQRKDTIV